MTTTPENQVQCFYKHTNDQKEIGRQRSSERETFGPFLKQAFVVLVDGGLEVRAQIYAIEGNRSGDLYVVHRRLFELQDEGSFMTASVAGDKRAQVYEVVMNNTNGWAQYLSLVMKGPFDASVAERLGRMDFAPRHTYLAKNDQVVHPEHRGGLWIDDFVDFNPLLRKLRQEKD